MTGLIEKQLVQMSVYAQIQNIIHSYMKRTTKQHFTKQEQLQDLQAINLDTVTDALMHS